MPERNRYDEPVKAVRKRGYDAIQGAHRQYTITLFTIADHLNVIQTPLLNKFNGEIRLHYPSKDRIEHKDNLLSTLSII